MNPDYLLSIKLRKRNVKKQKEIRKILHYIESNELSPKKEAELRSRVKDIKDNINTFRKVIETLDPLNRDCYY